MCGRAGRSVYDEMVRGSGVLNRRRMINGRCENKWDNVRGRREDVNGSFLELEVAST